MVENEAVFDQIIADAWNCDEALSDDTGVAVEPVKGKSAAAGRADGGINGAGDLNDMLLMAGLNIEAFTGKGGGGKGRSSSAIVSTVSVSEPHLVVTDWWLEHLRLKERDASSPGSSTSDLTALQWVYGKIASQMVRGLIGSIYRAQLASVLS